MGWVTSPSLGDIKEECLTEEAKEKIRKEEQCELEHPFGSVQEILMLFVFYRGVNRHDWSYNLFGIWREMK